MVIEGHVCFFGMGVDSPNSLSEMLLYNFNMPLFFFVSGFFANKRNILIGEAIRKICQKFVFLVIPALIFYVLLKLKSQGNPIDFLSKGAGGYWFTITLWECFLLYYVVSLILRSGIFQNMALISLAVLGIIILSLYDDLGPQLLDINRLAKFFQYFVLGVMAKKYSGCYEKIIKSEGLKAFSILVFFGILFTICYNFWPRIVYQLMRELGVRYLGLFIVVSWFVDHSEIFNKESRINKVILDIGRKSLGIYLLQYFFLPDFTAYSEWLEGMDSVTIHLIAFGYTAFIVAACYIFISLLSNSSLIRKYVLGQK